MPDSMEFLEGTSKYGWRLNPLTAEVGDQVDIIVEIDRSIQETCIQSKGLLDANADGSTTYEMPWHKYSGSHGCLSPLCIHCHRFFDTLEESSRIYTFDGAEWASSPDSSGKSYLKHIERAIKCSFCRLRWDQLYDEDRKKLETGFSCAITGTSRPKGYNHSQYDLLYSYSVHDTKTIRKSILMLSRYNFTFPNSFMSRSTNSATSWALARLWLQHCINNHKECRNLQTEDRQLPTRLIDLGPGFEDVRPKLCYSKMLPHDTKYMTLSHRWGAINMIQLTLKTLEAWSEALPVDEIPPTFKNAMEAAKQLGVQFLWIDCLCIIQDSDEDWQREAAAMGSVYRSSHCNLTAIAPNSNSNTGLFAFRDPSTVQMCCVETRTNFSLKQGYNNHWFCWDATIWERNVKNSPLFKRGWVTQEYILAPRVLHFGGGQMFWDCPERRACETMPEAIPSLDFDKKLSLNANSVQPGPLMRVQGNLNYQSTKLLTLWGEIINRYSETSLTFPTLDKLTAISGLAKSFGIKGEYLAGIWRENMEIQLLWHQKNTAILTQPKEYQAPTWSWASVNGGVISISNWLAWQSIIVVNIMSVHLKRAGQDPTGRVHSGQIRICGPLAPVTICNAPTATFEKLDVSGWYRILECEVIWALLDRPLTGKESELYALMVIVDPAVTYSSACKAKGILLEPTGKREDEYYRRGIFYAEANKAEFDSLLKLFKCPEKTLEAEDHEINDGTYTVKFHSLREITLI